MCARVAGDATDPREHARFVSERHHWPRILADEIGTDVGLLEAAIASLPRGEMYMMVRMSASGGNAARLLRLFSAWPQRAPRVGRAPAGSSVGCYGPGPLRVDSGAVRLGVSRRHQHFAHYRHHCLTSGDGFFL
jgi:hypothetical protein